MYHYNFKTRFYIYDKHNKDKTVLDIAALYYKKSLSTDNF